MPDGSVRRHRFNVIQPRLKTGIEKVEDVAFNWADHLPNGRALQKTRPMNEALAKPFEGAVLDKVRELAPHRLLGQARSLDDALQAASALGIAQDQG